MSSDRAAATLAYAQKVHYEMRNTYIKTCAIGTFVAETRPDRFTLGDRIEAIPICALWN